MKISFDGGAGTYRIRAYAAGQIVVNDQTLTRSVVVMAEQVLDWPPQSVEEFAPAHFGQLTALHPEIVLIGTGAKLRFPPPSLFAPLYAAGIGTEVMDTGAACRTYNILLAEGRAVAAALLMI